MPAETTIVEVCDALREALRRRGMFEGGLDPDARRRGLSEAVEEAQRSLGRGLSLTEEVGRHTVAADGVPGLVTVVLREDVAGGKLDPEFAVTSALA